MAGCSRRCQSPRASARDHGRLPAACRRGDCVEDVGEAAFGGCAGNRGVVRWNEVERVIVEGPEQG